LRGLTALMHLLTKIFEGFDYEFNALNERGEENELNSAFTTIFKQSESLTVLNFLRFFVPLFRAIVCVLSRHKTFIVSLPNFLNSQPTSQSRGMANAGKVMNRIGRSLVNDKKKAILAAAVPQGKYSSGEAQIEKSSITTRDLLSRLMAANMATDLPENQRLSDEDVLARALRSSSGIYGS
jgi:hypothetical protein